MATGIRVLGRTVVCAAALAAAACGLDTQAIPPLSGPSGLALDVTLSATPEFLPRDGTSRSLITVTARDHERKPKANQKLRLSLTSSPETGGKLETVQLETGLNGQASVWLTAPSPNDNVDQMVVSVTPMTGNANTSLWEPVRIRLTGHSIPVPNFTFSPSAPAQFGLVAFDAGSTMVGGRPCPDCSYAWAFGSEATGTGVFTQYRFQQLGSYPVTLTVTSPTGTSAMVTKAVSVGAPPKPEAEFDISPTNPVVGETVRFNAAKSKSPVGTTIVRYRWNFGNGHEDTSNEATAGTSYDLPRTYTITLTVEDSNGQVSPAVSQTVAVTAPVPTP